MCKGEPDKARRLGITGRGLGKKGQGGGGDRRQLVAGAAAHRRPGAGQLAQQRRSSTDDGQDLVGDPQVGEPPPMAPSLPVTPFLVRKCTPGWFITALEEARFLQNRISLWAASTPTLLVNGPQVHATRDVEWQGGRVYLHLGARRDDVRPEAT
jgi:hypothetical protein